MKLTAKLGVVTLTAASMVSSASIPARSTQDTKAYLRDIRLRNLYNKTQKELKHQATPERVAAKTDPWDTWARNGERAPQPTRVFQAFENQPGRPTSPVPNLNLEKLDDVGRAPGDTEKVFDVTKSIFQSFHL